MSIFDEGAQVSQQQGALQEGIENLAAEQNRTFTFTEYTRYQLSEDGYVFWVQGSNTITVVGALHIATERDQAIDNTIAVNSVILDSESSINEFNTVNPASMWIAQLATPGGVVVPVAFQRRGPFFVEASIYHYAGFAVFPPLGPQLFASAGDLPTNLIVSNSFPICLSKKSIAPFYPSSLVRENIKPPYIVAHIEPELTKPIQPVPYYAWAGGAGFQNLTVYQLYRDHVQLILYGFTNAMAQQFYAGLIETSLNDETFGFSGEIPSIQDEKRTQPEIAAIAMKKTLSFDASYYQSAADAIARRLIVSATVQFDVFTADSNMTADSSAPV